MKNVKRILPLMLLLIFLAGCTPAVKCEAGNCTRVLFIGNSYTYVNDLPGTFVHLANAGGHGAEVDMAAPGGVGLIDHVNSGDMLEKLKASNWSYVVLQERSVAPSTEYTFTQDMVPAARTLTAQIRQYHAIPILYMTWGHRDGWPDGGINSYEAMQYNINNNYLRLAKGLNVIVAPVGIAWLNATRANPPIELWQSDGSHPTEAGTYLAACVFYATIFRQSPNGLSYYGGLSATEAGTLQALASKAVLGK